ncbi:DUF6174 domain-containing protein [Jidongwangia harbinensis]|uniref:DUF6174 domain-containing protein n=1 Tax=Jidongwangia harbinensis TaxID=2878561 RepID=UPI001CD93FB6|nr:DUF6174 domain-containing protein [Jidongwangia harbinensis]MCA2212222.1 DUF6174 domain-containing protein [Jidongwangia harbinensis]
MRRFCAGLAVLAALAGCTSTADPDPAPSASVVASPPPWSEPSDYGFVLERRCDPEPSAGRYRVVVREREVADADRVDGRTATGEEEISVPTLAELVEMAETAQADGAEVTSSFDPGDGHPTAVTIDRSGEKACFLITGYAPRSGS